MGLEASAQNDTIHISMSQTVHLRFTSELKYVNLGNRSMVAKIAEGSKDILAIKARESFDVCSSVSCLEANGRMHTFIVAYNEYPQKLLIDTRAQGVAIEKEAEKPVIEEVAEMEKELYHLGCGDYGIRVLCDNIFVKDDLMYIVLELQNSSAVSYEFAEPRFSVENRRKSKRSLDYEKSVIPLLSYGIGSIVPGKKSKMAFSFDKLALTKGQVLRIYMYEKNGTRNFVMSLGMNDINRARRL